VRKKRYGNRVGDEYVDWIAAVALRLKDLLAPRGSMVIELGNGWVEGQPVMSTLPLQTLLRIVEDTGLYLCQQFVCHNPARLPSPVQWVNVERIRVKDSFTHIWWLAATDRPKANNKNVLQPYKPSMQKLLRNQKYNSGRRPSGHVIGEASFLADNGGAIPPSVLEFANTSHGREYIEYCRAQGLVPHPATMPPGLAEFFIKFLTEKGDLVLDPFAGSNTTGSVSEILGRRWISVEADTGYVQGSRGRFAERAAT